MTWFYYVGRGIARTLLILLTRWKVRGKENVPAEGALLVVANHLNNVDPPLLGVSLKRKTIFMAKEELFRSPLSAYFIGNFGAFPVYRSRLDRKAIRRAQQVLSDGLALIMFPEGTRSKTAQLQPAFPGAALIARHNNVSILPIGIVGTDRLKGISWVLRRPRITVNIGRPFYLPTGGRLTKSVRSEQTNFIMEHIAALLPPHYRGVYGKK